MDFKHFYTKINTTEKLFIRLSIWKAQKLEKRYTDLERDKESSHLYSQDSQPLGLRQSWELHPGFPQERQGPRG